MESARDGIRKALERGQKAKQAKSALDATSPEVLEQIGKGLVKQIKKEPLSADTQKAFEDYINQFVAYVGAQRNLIVFLLGDQLEQNGD